MIWNFSAAVVCNECYRGLLCTGELLYMFKRGLVGREEVLYTFLSITNFKRDPNPRPPLFTKGPIIDKPKSLYSHSF